MNRDAAQEQFLRDALRVLRRQIWVIVLTTVIAVAAAVAYSVLKSKEYQATADLRPVDQSEYLPALGVGAGGFNNLPAAQRAAQSAELVTSPEVVDAVAKDVTSDLSTSEVKDAVSTSVNPDNNLITVTTGATSAKLATDLANAYADETKTAATDRQHELFDTAADNLKKQAKKQDDQVIRNR